MLKAYDMLTKTYNAPATNGEESRVETLLGLPGVSEYTARAVACFAYGRRVPVVDTNVRRVVARATSAVMRATALDERPYLRR